MFPVRPGPTSKDRTKFRKAIVEAKQLCKECPVKTECLDRSLTEGHNSGVWGGVFFDSEHDVREQLTRQQYRQWNRRMVRRFREIAEAQKVGTKSNDLCSV